MSEIKDIALSGSGERKIEWVKKNMSLLRELEEEFREKEPFSGIKIGLSIHLEAKTAYLCRVLAAGGAEMFITGSNPLSTQDDVAAALVASGMEVFARHNCTKEEYDRHIEKVIDSRPNIIIDDGGDLVHFIHENRPEYLPDVIGGCEETTTGIIRLEAMAREGKLSFPMIKVNNAKCKYLFDNRYGTGQSVWDGINRTTNLIVAGKYVVVAGYGWCGKGIAMRAKGFGAKVIVTEIDPIKALEAKMDGFDVMPMEEAAQIGDLFVTATGCCDIISDKHFHLLKDGAILCNAGHFNVEVHFEKLEKAAVSKELQKDNIMGYTLSNGRTVYLIAEGRLVNLAAGDGHPAEIMDMSFAIQAKSAQYLAENRDATKEILLDVPEEIDRELAMKKLSHYGISIDTLTNEQIEYLNS